MNRCRLWQRFDTVVMGRQDHSDTPNQVPVGRESAPREQRLKPIDDRVKFMDQAGYLVNSGH
jgi:hypothetical protein